jgi:hypothetical protein
MWIIVKRICAEINSLGLNRLKTENRLRSLKVSKFHLP